MPHSARSSISRPSPRPPVRALGAGAAAAGFTFIELMLVIVIMGLLMSLAAFRMDGLVPKYRLRSAVRELGTTVEKQRLAAISRGCWVGIRYQVGGEETSYELLPPPPKEFPDQPVADRTPGPPHRMPGPDFVGIRIQNVQQRGLDPVENGSVLILFSPDGTSGSHAVTMEGPDGMHWTMIFNAITGTVDYRTSEKDAFDDFED